MATVKQNIVIDQGSSYSQDFKIFNVNNEPYDITNMTAAAQMRKNYMSSNAVSFTTTLTPSILTLNLAAGLTANLIPGRYLYDIVLTTPAKTTRIIEGIATITPAVTR